MSGIRLWKGGLEGGGMSTWRAGEPDRTQAGREGERRRGRVEGRE